MAGAIPELSRTHQVTAALSELDFMGVIIELSDQEVASLAAGRSVSGNLLRVRVRAQQVLYIRVERREAVRLRRDARCQLLHRRVAAGTTPNDTSELQMELDTMTMLVSQLSEAGECADGRKREPIPKPVQYEVWRRDEGKCVQCGSQNSLEFDHIIPVAKGGSNTARNIQLLCEACNRSKSDRI